MNNIVLQKTWVQGRPVVVDNLLGTAFTGEAGAHTFKIRGVDAAQETVTISGTITGKLLAANNVTVSLSGSIEDGCAVVTLTDECYDVPGRFIFSVYATSGSTTLCLYCAVGNVLRTDSQVIAYPTESLPNITSLMADLEQILADWPADYSQLQSDVSSLKSALGASAASQYVLSDNKAGYVNDSFTFVANNNWRSLIADLDMVLVNDTITLQRGTLYGYNENDAKISSIGFFDKTGVKLFGWYVNQAQGTVVKRTQIPDGTAYVVFNTTNVSAGFDILCNTILSQVDSLRDGVQSRHVRTCTLTGSYNGNFVYAPLYVRAGDIVTINGTYNGNNPVLFFSDGKRDNQWVRCEQIDTAYFTTGYIVPTSGWAGFTAWAATETGTKSYTFSITVLTPRNIAEPMNEIVVAASNSIEDDKISADFVCDGTDDATVINNAISVAQRIGVTNVVLSNGDYYINSYVEYNLQGSLKKIAILIHDALGKEGITLTGRKDGLLPHKAKLVVQESIFSGVGSDEELYIISGGSPESGYQGSHGFNVKNLLITLPNATHKCVVINMQYAYWGVIDNCYIQALGFGQNVVPAEGCIGIRGWAGWSDGVNIGIKDTYVFGCYVGFQLGGEHVICERLGTRFCYYGYTFGEYSLVANSGAQVHPITLINCCDEHSAALPKFCKSGNANTPGAGRCAVDMISFVVEAYPLTSSPLIYAEESTPGGWVGRIDYTIENNEKNNSVSLPFWKTGHGLYFRTTNSAQLAAGTPAERANYAPNLAQTYYDTTLGKLLVYNGSAWVDANGTAV